MAPVTFAAAGECRLINHSSKGLFPFASWYSLAIGKRSQQGEEFHTQVMVTHVLLLSIVIFHLSSEAYSAHHLFHGRTSAGIEILQTAP